MKKVLVCGARDWTDKDAIMRVLSGYPKDTLVIHGDQGKVDKKTGQVISGADKLAGECAKELGMQVDPHPANWKLGRGAGMIRNKEMIALKPDEVIGFHRDLSKSKGTKDMINLARKAGIRNKVFTGE